MWMMCWAVFGGGVPALFGGYMAVAAGAKKNKNGRRVYSQTANAIRKRQEAGSGEFAEDYVAAAEITQPPAQETPPEAISSPGGFSTETIGVTTTATIAAPTEPAAPEEEEPSYFCDNCKHKPITPADSRCPTCEEILNWDGLN